MTRVDIAHMDAIEWLQQPHLSGYRMMFADPPDGINLKYQGFKDKISDEAYEYMLFTILNRGADLFKFMWLSINPKWVPMIGHVTYEWQKMHPDWTFKPCVQTFTFGQNNNNDFGVGHRLLYRYQKTGATLYMDSVRVPSWRQLNGDKRADPKGRVPLDVFDFPRVTGNSKQRRKFSPTQLHEGLYERCIRSCCAKGNTVVDLFGGSGTLGRVAPRCEVSALMIELSRETVDNILADQPETVEVYY
jgi:site-specific DNA-methyltransferase (adenine-specific)